MQYFFWHCSLLSVLCSVTLSKCRTMPKYGRAQNSRTSALSSNTVLGLMMFTEVTVLFLQQNCLFFYIAKTFILYNNNILHIIDRWLLFVWYKLYYSRHENTAQVHSIFMSRAVYSHITYKEESQFRKAPSFVHIIPLISSFLFLLNIFTSHWF